MVKIRREDLRIKKYTTKVKTGILFVVDASRSQGVKKRLAFAKGAVLSLLCQAYISRDKVGMIIFYDKKCELTVPMTKSVDFAAARLQNLPASGNTPLGMGLRKALEVFELEKKRSGDFTPLLILLTDGNANFDNEEGNPAELAIKAAEQIKKAEIPALVIDTEKSIFSLGLAKKIADTMNAKYLSLPYCGCRNRSNI